MRRRQLCTPEAAEVGVLQRVAAGQALLRVVAQQRLHEVDAVRAGVRDQPADAGARLARKVELRRVPWCRMTRTFSSGLWCRGLQTWAGRVHVIGSARSNER